MMMTGAVTIGPSLDAQQAPPVQTPPPRPSPMPLPKGATQPTPTSKPAADAAKPASGPLDLASIDARLAGISGYPGAEFLATYDAGTNQKLFMFGTNEPYEAVLAFYKTQFKKSGEEVSRQPRIQQFDLAGYNSGTMSQRPSVIVKDYTLPDPAGYLHVSGTTERRYKTVIEIIPSAK
jgi:hypothetical protein